MEQKYECRIRYEKNIDGKLKKVTEAYLVDALSYTEAEARIIKEQCQYIGGEYQITNIKRAKYAELFPSQLDSDDRWYNCKIHIMLLDEAKGVEKKVAQMLLVQASSVESAIKYLNEGMKGTLSDYVIVAVSESPIVDFFPYTPDSVIVKSIES